MEYRSELLKTRHSRESGNPVKENIPYSRDNPQRHLELNRWIPAFAGMTLLSL